MVHAVCQNDIFSKLLKTKVLNERDRELQQSGSLVRNKSLHFKWTNGQSPSSRNSLSQGTRMGFSSSLQVDPRLPSAVVRWLFRGLPILLYKAPSPNATHPSTNPPPA